ncbi:AP-3 complex subunit beta, variant 3 [Entomophthora muscae]|uniref:AP-3 complex subunit beta, variant 3 n=1 Tax=Entomophthora muscae TaxID=34485 RepID=A0ACC2RTW0_9FUNG|nr:AP-3 complex subunit beta, variant 3 [Entomophthora muscae]
MAEYLNRAAALAQSAAELSRKVSENIIDRSRELGLDPTSLQTYEVDVKPQDIKNYLDSNHERDKISALRKIIKLISKGVDTSEHFAGVVKNVASKSLEVRKLVYIYILRYAEQEPDLALLSINTFQKDLTDPSPVIRALALRVLSGIRVRIITPIVVLALRKSAADLSPYVRKSAAFALVKCQTLDPGQTESILELLRVYLEDNSHISLGGVVMAFNQICPQRYDLIHPHYRKLCRLLPEFDEWSQISTLQLLLRYARTQFIDPCQNKEESPTKRKPSDSTAAIDGFYEDIEAPRVGGLDPDHALLLKSVAPLLLSQNSGVVLSTATLIFHTSPDASSIAKPLVRLLRSHRETQYIVLTNISVMADSKPGIFSPYLSSFYVRAGDPKMVRDLKLDIASAVVTPSTLDALLKELFSYSQSPDEDLARISIRAMAKCIACSPKATARCLSALLNLLNDKNHMVVGEAITAIKQLLQSFFSEDTTSSVLARLVHLFHKDYETLPSVAKAAILWLVGQYSSLLVQYAPDIFRVAVRDFAEAEEEFKMQTLTLGIKLMAQFPDHRVSPFFSHLMALARYDRNFHVRDRARLIQGSYILSQGDGFLRNHLQGLFCNSKPAPTLNSLAQDRKRFSLGSASLQLNHQVRGYQPLPEWPLEQPDGSARNKVLSLFSIV